MSGNHLLVFKRAPCSKCGAKTVTEAEKKCIPVQDQTGEYTCPGIDEDADGYFQSPTTASIKAMDQWIDAKARRLGRS